MLMKILLSDVAAFSPPWIKPLISLDFLIQFVYIWKQSSAELENQNFECSNSRGFLFE